MAQVDVDLEVIVVDDASDDGTAERVEAYIDARRERRVRLLRRTVNAGPAGARNLALAAAQGEWMAILDADDRMAPERLRTLIDAGVLRQADIVVDNLWICDASGVRVRRHLNGRDDGGSVIISLRDYALQNRMFSGRPALGYLKPIFRRSFLEQKALAYDETLRVGEDFLLVAEALADGARLVRVRSSLYDYITHASSISHRLGWREALRMRDADDEFLRRRGPDLQPEALSAMRRHRRSLDDAQAFIGTVAALKDGQLFQAAGLAFGRPLSLRHLHMPVSARLRRLVRP